MDDTTTVKELDSLLAAARSAARDGRLAEAHRLLTQITQREPQNVEAWLWRAATAATREDTLVALGTALELDPQDEGAQLAMYETLKRQLGDDPFLAYVSETDPAYQVHTASQVRVVVPKKRAVPRPYPRPEPGPLQPVARWLLLALLGLLPSGLGAFLFAPMALISALRLRASALSHEDQKRRRMSIAAALFLWILGLLLGALFVIRV